MSTDDIRAADDLFSHGAAYPAENGLVQPRPCTSCAFTDSPETVRPADIPLAALEAATADYDDFLCHCFDASGRAYTCAGWAARFGKDSPEVRAKLAASRKAEAA